MESIHFNHHDQKIWDQIFENSDPAWKQAPPQSFMKDTLDFLKANDVETVLDLGCGVGVWSVFLARKGFKVSAADFSKNAIRHAESWAMDESLDIRFSVAPITEDAFPDEKFDAAVAPMILDNVSSREMQFAIELVRSKLRPNGVFFALFNPNLTEAEKRKILESTKNPTKDLTSITYTDEEIQDSFPGFNVLNFKKYPLQGLVFRGVFLQA